MADITYIGDKKKGGAPALPAGQSTVVHCLMIPLTTDILLLPNAAIAEVVAARQPAPIAGKPDWYLGKMEWRDYQVPVVAFEMLNGDVNGDISITRGGRIAILNTLNGNAKLPYIGLVTQGIPRLQVVQNKAIETSVETEGRHKNFISEFVMVNGEPVSIPDIDLLEKAVIESGI